MFWLNHSFIYSFVDVYLSVSGVLYLTTVGKVPSDCCFLERFTNILTYLLTQSRSKVKVIWYKHENAVMMVSNHTCFIFYIFVVSRTGECRRESVRCRAQPCSVLWDTDSWHCSRVCWAAGPREAVRRIQPVDGWRWCLGTGKTELLPPGEGTDENPLPVGAKNAVHVACADHYAHGAGADWCIAMGSACWVDQLQSFWVESGILCRLLSRQPFSCESRACISVELSSRFLSRAASLTRDTFCGTWYLPRSQVHNDQTVPIIMARCIAHAWNGNFSTSALNSDVTIVFFYPDFLHDAKISPVQS